VGKEETRRASTKMGQGGGWAGDGDHCLSFQKKDKSPLETAAE